MTATPTPRVGALEFGFSRAFDGLICLFGSDFHTRLVPHVHSTYVLGVVDRGEVEVTVRGETRLASAGSVIVLPPFEPHTEIPGDDGWSFRYLYPSESLVRAALGGAGANGWALGSAPIVIDDPLLAAGITQAHLWMTLVKPTPAIEALLVSIVERIRDAHVAPREAGRVERAARDRIRHAQLSIIDGRYPRPRVIELAREAGLSEFHFHHRFREFVGLSPYAFFDRVRIARAHDLLFFGESPIKVTHQLEYADQPHFTRHFSRASCVTPGQYASMGARARAAVG